MKVIPLFTACMLSIFLIQAQHEEAPVKDFNLQFSATSIEINRGQSGKLELSIQKSKQFQKGNVKLGTASKLPSGISVAYEPATGVISASSITIHVATETVPGTYNLILNGTINQKTKGSIVKLTIL